MQSKSKLKPWCRALIVVILVTLGGCSTSDQLVSPSSIEERIAALRIGQSTKSDVEKVLGTDHSTDRNRWSYNISDTSFDIGERRQGPGMGVLPVSAGVVRTNTRAVVTAAFDDAGVMKRLEVARFFDAPFINDYWYMVKDSANEPLPDIAKIGEAVGMKAVGLDKESGTFTLEDIGSKAKIAVKLDGKTLHLTSRNPHSRLASEYRAYTKREYALTSNIADSDIVR
jgi:outer membrane protein assembly factor BamE (lipoprotein component of BamABCDE complex)